MQTYRREQAAGRGGVVVTVLSTRLQTLTFGLEKLTFTPGQYSKISSSHYGNQNNRCYWTLTAGGQTGHTFDSTFSKDVGLSTEKQIMITCVSA